MEQTFCRWIPNFLFIFALLSAAALVGCKSEDPNPELMDPIYADLVKMAKDADSAVKDQEKNIEELQKNIERDDKENKFGQRDRFIHEKQVAEKALTALRQNSLYYDIRAEQRKEFDRKDYLMASRAGQPWPRPEEKAEYDETKKLKFANRNWGSRVPKTTKYTKGSQPAPKEAKKEEAPKPAAAE